MATVTKVLARTSFATSSGTLYAADSGITTVVTNILIVNTSAASQTFSILFDDVEVFPETTISGKGTISMDLKQVLDGTVGGNITGYASGLEVVKVHISGVEIS
jgi:virulence-associated protein VapD